MPNRPIVAVTRDLPGEIIIPGAELRVGGEDVIPRDELLGFVKGASGMIAWVTERIDAELIEAAGEQLKVVANYAVGHDNIDMDACRERGVIITNTPDAVTEGTANHAIGLMLAAARRLVEGDRYIRSGGWVRRGVLGPKEFIGLDISGKTMVVLGAGRIGYATALRARAFGMRVAYVARSQRPLFESEPVSGERVSLDDGLAQGDVLSIHCPLTDQTRHMIDAAALAKMKPTAILVNTARGPIVDEAALGDALKNRRIWAAGLDVFEDEPRVHPDLVGLDNVVMTPHFGSAEIRYREEMTRMACANVEAVLNGNEPPNRVS